MFWIVRTRGRILEGRCPGCPSPRTEGRSQGRATGAAGLLGSAPGMGVVDGTDPTTGRPDDGRDEDAQVVALLFERYARRLAHLAEQHLSRKLAGRLDGEDVVQSVFRTFFRRSALGEFRIDSSDQIWRLLVKMTV